VSLSRVAGRLPPFLVATTAYNAHVQHMARALYEADALSAYVTGGVDHFPRGLASVKREAIRRWLPGLDRQLRRRAVTEVPADLVHAQWGWEIPRLIANRAGAPRLEDWCWERGDLAADRHAAARLREGRFQGFLGVEHGALTSLQAAKSLGKAAVVAFLSPHRATRIAWLDREYERMPSLRTSDGQALDALSQRRDARRDEEARTADWVLANSSFTTQSLIDAGVEAGKILTVPLGAPDPIDEAELPRRPPASVRFVFVGPLSVRKGAHYLLGAWRRIAGPGAELHFYGQPLLPAKVVDDARAAHGGDKIVLHGSVPSSELSLAYRSASVLVFPTLCDGFGMVASEALANGLPVITTRNAGAADAVEPGRSGFVIAPADEDALVSSMQWCLDHPRELFAMRSAALASARRWTWTDFRQAFRMELGAALETGIGPGGRAERGQRVAH